MDSPGLAFVRTADRGEEAAVIRHLGAAGDGETITVPVPASLGPALSRIAARHAVPARFVSFAEHTAHGCARRRDPARIVTVGDVDPMLTALARAVEGIQEREDECKAALVLYDGVASGELLRCLDDLASRGTDFGIVTTSDDEAGHLALLKALLVDAVDIADVDTLESPWMHSAAANRMLVINGHGNAVDVGSINAGVMCSRGPAGHSAGYASAYPCFNDGRCFRQPLFGREPASPEGLFDASTLTHPIVLLLGCGTMPLGGPAAHRSTIVGGMRGSDVLGGVAAGGILYHDASVESFLIALLLDGRPLGAAVREFNAWHRAMFGRTSASSSYGPLIAFGHPHLRVRRSFVRDVQPDGAALAADVGTITPNGRAVLKLTSLSSAAGALQYLDSSGGKAYAAQSGSNGSTTTYVSLTTTPNSEFAPLLLRDLDHEQLRAEVTMLRDSMSMFPFWRTFLAHFVDRGSIDEQLLAALRVREETERTLLRYLAGDPFDGTGVICGVERLLLHDGAVSLWRRWLQVMLMAAARHVQQSGGFTFHVWQDVYRRLRDEQRPRLCPTCMRATCAIGYVSQSAPADAHDLIQCFACGVLGELPRGIGVTIDAPPILRGGEEANVSIAVTNERPVPIEILALAVRECWFRETPDLSQPANAIVDSGETRIVALPLTVSASLTPGLYPLTIVGVANGALIHLRHHIPLGGVH